MKPQISVVIPVHSQEREILVSSIDSILNQKKVNVEIIIIDDHSIIPVRSILKEYLGNNNIKIIRNSHKLGVARSLNKGIYKSTGKYIARMDSDDMSMPLRLYKQKKYLDINPNIDIVGSWVQVFGDFEYIRKTSTNPDKVAIEMLFRNSIAHPSVMCRSNIIKSLRSIYDCMYETAEDYKLWSSFIYKKSIANFGEVLLKYRSHSKQVGSKKKKSQDQTADKIREELVKSIVDNASKSEIALHNRIAKFSLLEKDRFEELNCWLYKIHINAMKKMSLSRIIVLQNFIEEVLNIIRSNIKYLSIWSLFLIIKSIVSLVFNE